MRLIDDILQLSDVEPVNHPARIAHYYGDTVRKLMLATAIAILVGAPFYATDLRTELPFDIVGALILICFAAFTSPRSRTMMVANTVAAGVGMVLFELWALTAYGEVPPVVVAIRQAIAVVFVFAFYFAGKSLRHMNQMRMGEEASSSEDRIDDLRAMSEELEEIEDYTPQQHREETEYKED